MEEGGEFRWSKWSTYQSEAPSTPRVRKHREKKRLETLRSVSRNGETPLEVDVELDVDVDGDVEEKKETTTSSSRSAPTPHKLKLSNQKPKRTTQSDTVQIVFDLWQEVWGHPQAKLSQPRKRIILERLKDGYTRDELCKVVVGWWFTDWKDANGRLVRQNGGDKLNGITTLLRINNKGDNVTDGLELYDSNAREASKLLPLDMAVRSCSTYDEMLESQLLYKVAGVSVDEGREMWTAMHSPAGPNKWHWRQWAFAVLCEWCNGCNAETIDQMGRSWVAGDAPPKVTGDGLSDADKEWIGNLGRICPVEATQ